MPIPPYPVLMTDWESLLTALEEAIATRPHLEPMRAGVQERLEKARKIKAKQESAQAARQRATQELDEQVREGLYYMKGVRGVLLHEFGALNEQLVRFGMKPARKRSRRARATEPDMKT